MKKPKDRNFCCPYCGSITEKPIRPAIGTKVTHPTLGKGVIFSYDQCDDFSCGVDFGAKDKWCMAIRNLEIDQ